MRKIIIVILLTLCAFLAAAELDLENAWEMLLAHNPQVQSEKLIIADRTSDTKLAIANMLPSGNLNASYNPDSNDLDKKSMGYSFSISQPVYQGGKLYNSYVNSKKELQQAELNYQNLLLFMRGVLETKYYSVLEKRESLEIAKSELAYSASNLSAAEIRYENGSISQGELWQLRSNSAQQEVSILKAKTNLQIAVNGLKSFLDYQAELNLEPVSIIDYQQITTKLGNWEINDLNAVEIRLINHAISNNPDYESQALGVIISETQLQSAKGNFLPSVNMSISRSWNYKSWGDDPDGSLNLGINASIPVFSIYDNCLNYAKARNNLSRSELSKQQTKLDLKLEIKSGILNLVAAVQELNAAGTAQEYAEISYQAAAEQFKNKMITANELLNTQIVLRTAESNLNSSIYSFLNYKSDLQQSLGILVETELWQLLLTDQ